MYTNVPSAFIETLPPPVVAIVVGNDAAAICVASVMVTSFASTPAEALTTAGSPAGGVTPT